MDTTMHLIANLASKVTSALLVALSASVLLASSVFHKLTHIRLWMRRAPLPTLALLATIVTKELKNQLLVQSEPSHLNWVPSKKSNAQSVRWVIIVLETVSIQMSVLKARIVDLVRLSGPSAQLARTSHTSRWDILMTVFLAMLVTIVMTRVSAIFTQLVINTLALMVTSALQVLRFDQCLALQAHSLMICHSHLRTSTLSRSSWVAPRSHRTSSIVTSAQEATLALLALATGIHTHAHQSTSAQLALVCPSSAHQATTVRAQVRAYSNLPSAQKASTALLAHQCPSLAVQSKSAPRVALVPLLAA